MPVNEITTKSVKSLMMEATTNCFILSLSLGVTAPARNMMYNQAQDPSKRLIDNINNVVKAPFKGATGRMFHPMTPLQSVCLLTAPNYLNKEINPVISSLLMGGMETVVSENAEKKNLFALHKTKIIQTNLSKWCASISHVSRNTSPILAILLKDDIKKTLSDKGATDNLDLITNITTAALGGALSTPFQISWQTYTQDKAIQNKSLIQGVNQIVESLFTRHLLKPMATRGAYTISILFSILSLQDKLE